MTALYLIAAVPCALLAAEAIDVAPSRTVVGIVGSVALVVIGCRWLAREIVAWCDRTFSADGGKS